MEDVDAVTAVPRIEQLTELATQYLADNPPAQHYFRYYLSGLDRKALQHLSDVEEETVDFLSNSQDKLLVNKLADYPVLRNLYLYCPTPERWMAWTAIVLFPIGVPVWLLGRKLRRDLRQEIEKIIQLNTVITNILQK